MREQAFIFIHSCSIFFWFYCSTNKIFI